MKLLLFDIDGTLLLSGGAGRMALQQALEQHCERPIATDQVPFSGKTDPLIVRELLEVNRDARAASEPFIQQILHSYRSILPDYLDPNQVQVLPGVRNLLERLREDSEVHLGLLTGNLQHTAHLKLEAAGLAQYFSFGAYGSDHADRHHLPGIAVEAAARRTGRRFTGHETVIIGDTVHDIRCGVHIGAMSVAVCTGRYGRTELAACKPDVLLENLADPEAFYNRVLSLH